MTYPWENQPTMRRPTQADDEDAGDVYDDDVYYTTRIPARARYIPLAQRDTFPPPVAARQVFVVDRRQGRGNSRGGNRSLPHPAASAPQRQQARRLPQPQARQTQADPMLSQQEAPEEVPVPSRHRRHWHQTVYVGLGMFAMLALWYLGLTFLSWWQVSQDDLHYGRPRTFQTDAVVGHHDSPSNPSHFIALNLHGQVEIIEFPGGDASHAKIYLGPMLAGGGQDLTPVTLSFRDVNGDVQPDMLITIQGSQVVFLNDHGQFRPFKPGEHVHL